MRAYDSSLSTDFEIEAVFSQGQWNLRRKDDVNWGSTGVTINRRINGSGPKAGPVDLVTQEQAEQYARHLAALWNAAISGTSGATL